jgi:HSP20 family molecular chaperone IbpA
MFCVPARGRSYSYRERRYGVFAYALRFPCEVDADSMQADYKYSVLWGALSRNGIRASTTKSNRGCRPL